MFNIYTTLNVKVMPTSAKKSLFGISSFFSARKKTIAIKSNEPIDLRTDDEKFLLLVENVLVCYEQTKNSLFTRSGKKTDTTYYNLLKQLYENKTLDNNSKIFQLKQKLKEFRNDKLIMLFEKIDDESHKHSYFELLLIQSGLVKLPLDMKMFAEKCVQHAVKVIEEGFPRKDCPF